ncbi:MAG TPA: hypothetical protein VNN62_21200 [Methylomirabilota bacterium]|jgi:hypothetical protein|nr:hypothetical protein [Methylomirabilota bacterium]
MNLAHRLLRLDRRIIFLLIGLATLLPLLYPVGLPIRVSPEVRRVYDYIERLPQGSVILLSFDFEPGGKPELYPMAIALLRHAFRKNLKVIGMTLWPAGAGLAETAFAQVAQEMHKERGADYVFLGYAPGDASAVISMGQDFHAAFPTDYYGVPTDALPVLKNIRTLRDLPYVLSLSVGFPGLDTWYVYGKEKYGFELGGGCTAVSAPRFYPLLDTGQINGLLGGLRGAAEYEILLGAEGKALAGMDAQSATHFLIIFLILICNSVYFLTGRRKRRR